MFSSSAGLEVQDTPHLDVFEAFEAGTILLLVLQFLFPLYIFLASQLNTFQLRPAVEKWRP